MDTDLSREWSDIQILSIGEYNAIYTANRYGKRYVLKALKEEYRQSAPHLELLRKEFRLGLPLDHTNVVRTIDWDYMDSIGFYIQLEYIDGVTLSEFLMSKIGSSIKRHILLEILDATEYLHQHQIIHRDIKPSNILVTRNGQHIKLIDLGVADADDYIVLKQPAGSYTFMAPEQLAGDVLDARADIYAIGKLIRLLYSIRYGLISRKCTALNRQKRYSNCTKVKSAILRADIRNVSIPILALLCCLVGMGYNYLGQLKTLDQHMIIRRMDDLMVSQTAQTDAMQLTIDSLQQVIDWHNEKSQQLAKKVDEQEEWIRVPSDEEIEYMCKHVEQMLRQKADELDREYKSGALDNIRDRKDFYGPIHSFIEVGRKNIHNEKLQNIYTQEVIHASQFWMECDTIFQRLPHINHE